MILLLWLTMMMEECMGLSEKDANVCRSRWKISRSKLVCCFGHVLKNDKCVPCPLGFYGNNCLRTCIDGHYGYMCGYECKCDERTEYCDKRLGCTTKKKKKMVNDNNNNNSFSFWDDDDDEKKKILDVDDDDDDDDFDPFFKEKRKGKKKEIIDDEKRVMVKFAYYLMYGSIGFVMIFFLLVLGLSSICLIYCKIMKDKKKKKKKKRLEEEEEEEHYRSPIYKEPINYWHMGTDNNCYFSDDDEGGVGGGDVNAKEDIKRMMML